MKEENLSKANRRLSKKINSLSEDLEAEIQNIVRKGKNELEDIVDNSCNRMKDIVRNEWSRFKSFDSVQPRLDAELQTLVTRKLKRATENLAAEGKKKINRNIGDFFSDAEDLLMRFLPDFDSRTFIKSTQNKIQLDMESNDLFAFDNDSENNDYGLGDLFWDFLNRASLGIFKVAGNVLNHSDSVAKVENVINSISNEFDPNPFLDNAFKSKDAVIDFVKQTFISNLIEPLQEQIKEIRSKMNDKENELKLSEKKRSELEEQKKLILAQLDEINHIKALII